MSFELGLLTGLGRAAMKEREARAEQERLAREESEEQNRRSLGMLQKLVDTDDLLPDEARNVAAQHLFRLATNPKAKEKDFATAINEAMMIANRPRPAATPQNVASNAMRQIATQDYSFLDTIAPGMGQATNSGMQQMAPRLPEPEMVSGLITQGERDQREEARLRRNAAIQQEAAGSKFLPFADTQGLFDTKQGEVVREPKPAAPKTDYSRTPFEILIDPMSTPEQRSLAREAMTLQYTNQGDQMRSGGDGSANGPRYQRQVFQKPDGTYTEVLTNPYDPNEPPVRRDFGGGIDKPMTEGTKNAKAQAEGTLQMLEGVLTQIDSGAIDPNETFGKYNEFGYKLRSSGWLPFLDAPNPIESSIRTDMASFNNELTKLRSGAAVSAQEWTRLTKELPIAGMAPEEVVTRLRKTIERLRRIYALRYGPNGVGDATAFPGDVEAAAGPTTPAPRLPAPVSAAPRPAAAPAPAAAGTRLPPPPPPPGFVPVGGRP